MGRRVLPPTGWAPLLIGAVGAGLLAALFLSFPPGITPDSVHYLYAAQSLVREGTLFRYGHTLFLSWPPLYPALLAVPLAAGLTPFTAAKVINLLAYVLLGVWTWPLTRRLVRSHHMRLMAYAFIMWGFPVFWVHLHAWSEPFFLVFTTAFITLALRYIAHGGKGYLMGVVIALALATLQRYIGVVWIGVWVWWVWQWKRAPRRQRLLTAAGTAALALLPLSVWLLRNYGLSHTLTGPRPAPDISLITWFRDALWTIGEWVLPLTARYPLWSLVLTVTVAVFLVRWRRVLGHFSTTEKMLWGAAGAYLAFLALGSMTAAVDAPRQRLLSPIYPVFVLLLTARLEQVPRPWKNAAVAILFLTASFHIVHLAREAWRNDGFTFTHRWWRQHPTVTWVQQHADDHTLLLSNYPEVFFVADGMHSDPVRPLWNVSVPLDSVRPPRSKTVFLIWFHTRPRPWLHPLDSLRRRFPMRRVQRYERADIWEIIPDYSPSSN